MTKTALAIVATLAVLGFGSGHAAMRLPASALHGAIPDGVTATTQSTTDSSTKLATTANVHNVVDAAQCADTTASSVSGVLSLDLSKKTCGFVFITLTENTEIDASAPAAAGNANLIITQASSGGPYTVTWGSGFNAPNGFAVTTTAGGKTFASIVVEPDGTHYDVAGGAISVTDNVPDVQSGTTYTTGVGDCDNTLYLTSSSAVAVTLAASASAACNVGATLVIYQQGSGTVTLSGDTGVTIQSAAATAAAPETNGQYTAFACNQQTVDHWFCAGDLK